MVTGNRLKKSFNFTASTFSVKSRNTLHYPELHTYLLPRAEQTRSRDHVHK